MLCCPLFLCFLVSIGANDLQIFLLGGPRAATLHLMRYTSLWWAARGRAIHFKSSPANLSFARDFIAIDHHKRRLRVFHFYPYRNRDITVVI
jgi:hypothetical protein